MKTLLALTAALMCCPMALGQTHDTPATPKPAGAPTAQPKAPKAEPKPAMPSAEDMAKMQEAFKKAGKVGKEHDAMKFFAGNWDAQVTEFGGPEGSHTTPATMTGEMVMGGRFLSFTFSGQMHGAPMEGMGHMGYNNVDKQYESTWMSDTCTGIYSNTGTLSSDGKTWTFNGACTDPVSGKKMSNKMIWTITGKDTFKEEMWGDFMGTGKDSKMMEITYTRSSAKTEKKDAADKGGDKSHK